MAKVYTKTGDKGFTGLYGGKRVSKSDLRIEAYGTVDELNSYLGLIASFKHTVSASTIHSIQSILFDIGAHLALDPDKELALPEIHLSSIEMLESEIDQMDRELPTLKFFILPGGSTESAHCQIARTICRRAERRVVALAEQGNVNELIVQYLNRLSDYLFTLARFMVIKDNKEEIPWKPQK